MLAGKRSIRRITHPEIQQRNFSLKSFGKNIYEFARTTLGLDPPLPPDYPTPENRFHVWDKSPSETIRTRAAFIRARGKCPITGKNINFTCPKSGIPTHHDEEAWKSDTKYQQETWKILRKVNTSEHDLRSGREFPELEFPGAQNPEATVNFLNWDTFFYTRDFYSMDTEFQLAPVTKMLSYPITMGSVLHQFGPFSLGPKGPLTLEGLKSLAALRYTLFPRDTSRSWQDRPMRFFILGPRAESQLPPQAWLQLSYLFPDAQIELIFIGPEAHLNKSKNTYESLEHPLRKKFDSKLSFRYYTDYFHVLNEAQDFMPYDPYLDVFFLFHPGFGAPETLNQWDKTVDGLLESKCAIFVTGFHKEDSLRDWNWLHEKYADKMDVLVKPTPNSFGSLKWELHDLNPTEVYQFNQQIFGFRGKRYHTIRR